MSSVPEIQPVVARTASRDPPHNDDDMDIDEKAAAEVDPSSTIDPQTGAVIAAKTREERKFVLRLDLILLVYSCGSQILK